MKPQLSLLDDCDPWLSRAAREILRRHLSQWLGGGGGGEKDDTKVTVWEMIDQTMTLIGRTVDEAEPDNGTVFCPLQGMDVLRRQEEHSLPIPSRKLPVAYASSYVTENNYGHSNKKDPLPSSWYRCGVCQKTFLTRFYLDRHMMLNHRQLFQDELLSKSSSENNDKRLFCPAQQWCHFLVDSYDVAVDMEPYYSDGSGGWNENDRQRVAAVVRQRIPPCQEEALQETLGACRDMVDACFSHDTLLQDYLLGHLCAPQTCQDRLHRIILKSSSFTSSGMHLLWKLHVTCEWRMHGFIALVLLVCFFIVFRGYARRRHRNRPRSRLLQKPRHKWAFTRYYSKQKLS